MIVAVDQKVDDSIIDEAVVKKRVIGFGVGDADGVSPSEAKSICHGANIIVPAPQVLPTGQLGQ